MPKKRAVIRSSNRLRTIVVILVSLAAVAGGYIYFVYSASPAPEAQTPSPALLLPNRLGREDAPITILEFGEYQCPNCARFANLIKDSLVSKYVDYGIAKIYFRDFAYYGPDSISAAIAARCAGEQGKYWEYHDLLYAVQGPIESGWASVEKLKGFAEGIIGDLEEFNSCLDAERYREDVRSDYQEGLRRGVRGTPTFIIIGPDGREERIVGAQPLSSFEAVIESMLRG